MAIQNFSSSLHLPVQIRTRPLACSVLLVGLLAVVSGCGFSAKGDVAKAQSGRSGAGNQGPPAVNAAVARTEQLRAAQEYTGTTQALREVSLRSQVEGQLLSLNVDVGDTVTQGQAVAQIDDRILTADVTSAESELSARRAEIARLATLVSEAQKQVRQNELQLRQAQSDARRFRQLANQGAIAEQQAEQAETTARTAQEVLRSTQDQVSSRRQEIAIAEERLQSQQAVITQARQRRSYSAVKSPVAGYVTAKVNEAGNYLQPGTEIVKVGDFSSVKVVVQVSDLDLSQVRQGQAATVRFDAIAQQQFAGRIARISPAANPTSRLVPVEIIVPNASRRLGSGLLARVSFASISTPKIVVPLAALQSDRTGGQGQVEQREQAGQAPSAQGDRPQSQRPATGGATTASPSAEASQSNGKAEDSAQPATTQQTRGTLFVVTGTGEAAKVEARPVMLGEQLDGRVEILTGLKPGDRYVARSSRPLKNGESVRLSILSESSQRQS